MAEEKKTNAEIEELLRIVTKIAIRDVKARKQVALIKRDLRHLMEPIDEAREVPEEMKKYNAAHLAILRQYGTPLGGAGGSYSIPNAKMPEVQAAIAELNKEYAEALEREETRQKEIKELMDEPVEFKVTKLKEEWLGDNIDSNDFERLLDLDFLVLSEDKSK